MKLRILKHTDPLKCNHGGVVTFAKSDHETRVNKSEVLTDKDLLERATIACKHKRPCTRVIAVVQGLSTDLVVKKNEIPVLTNLSALTDGGPPGEVKFDASQALRQLLKAFLIHIEGPYVNDPDDPGGETNKGITWSTWKSLAPKVGIPADHDRFLQMSDQDWDAIYNYGFWDGINADDIDHPGVAVMLADFHFNSGTNGIQNIQSILTDDYGQTISPDETVAHKETVGPTTLEAINSVDGDELLNRYIQARNAFLQRFIDKHPHYRPRPGKESGLHRRVRELSEIIQAFVYGLPAAAVIDETHGLEDRASRMV